jgi:transcriptional regulator with XRE-family HTH domain
MTKRTTTPTFDAILSHVGTAGTVRERAARLGVPTTVLHRWEHGERPKALAQLDALAKALGLEITVNRKRIA